jgi:hypothetical protein
MAMSTASRNRSGSAVRDWSNARAQTDAYGRSLDPVKTVSNTSTTIAPAAGSTSGAGVADITSAFQKAIAALSGTSSDVEKTYQAGKRNTLSDIAMQSVNAGMANTLNMPAAGIAYDQANRAATNTAVAGQKAGVLTSLGQTLAGVYGTNVGSSTSLSNAQTAANTSTQNAALQYSLNQQENALQKYLAELEMKYKYGGSGGGGSVQAASISDLFA